MTGGYVVFCEICGHGWDERDPGVRFLNVDRAWTCTDEASCFDRRAVFDTLLPPPGVVADTFHDPYLGHGPRRYEGIDTPANWRKGADDGRE